MGSCSHAVGMKTVISFDFELRLRPHEEDLIYFYTAEVKYMYDVLR